VDGYGVVNGVRLHWVSAGDEAGPLVVLLHGFPDFWYGWRHQLPALSAAGYRAVALDLRGYNLSERPARVEEYRRDVLADDVAALVRHLGAERATIVGHDWGGVVAWHLAARRPEVVDRLAVLNAPHPARYRRLLRHTSQWARSWYVGFFQLPHVPEWTLRAMGHAALAAIWRGGHARPGAFGPRELAAYRAAFAAPGAVEAALAYYRALFSHPAPAAPERRVLPHRTLVVWGLRDGALVAANCEGLEPWVPRVRVVRVPEAAHWVMADAPAAVNAALLELLRTPSA
jgi:pimeloyl-ACP methyl ester carboxylesterase